MGTYGSDTIKGVGVAVEGAAGLAEWVVRSGRVSDLNSALMALKPEQLAAGVQVVLHDADGGERLETVAASPDGFVGKVQLDDVESFLGYLKRHATADHSSVYLRLKFGDDVPLKAVAVIDDHGCEPGCRVWLAVLEIALDTQAAAVLKSCTGVKTPLELAEVIEDNEDFIVDPPAARLLEIATTLKAAQNARLKEAHNLHNGDMAIEYVTETTATAGRSDGTLKIPEEVTLRLALFAGQPPRDLLLRFRYRVMDGRLVFSLSCPGFAHVVTRAAEELAAELRAGAPCPVYRGRVLA